MLWDDMRMYQNHPIYPHNHPMLMISATQSAKLEAHPHPHPRYYPGARKPLRFIAAKVPARVSRTLVAPQVAVHLALIC